MKAGQYFLKASAVFSTTVLLYVPMQTTEWALPFARGEMWSPEQAPNWRDKTELTSCGAPDPFWVTTMEGTLVEPHPGAPHTPSLALSISSEHTAHAPWQSSQHCIPLKRLFSNLHLGLAKVLPYRMAQNPPNILPYCICSSSPPLSQRHIPLSTEKNDLLL